MQFKHTSFLVLLFSIFLYSCQKSQPDISATAQQVAIKTEEVFKNYTHTEQFKADSLANNLHKQGFNLQDNFRKYKEAIHLYDEAIKIRKDILSNSANFQDTLLRNRILEGIIRSLNNTGQCYNQLREDKNAEKAFLKCLQKLDNFENVFFQPRNRRKAWASQSLGQIYQRNKDLATAKKVYEKSIFYGLIINDIEHVADVYTDLSNLYFDWKEPDSVILYAQKAIQIFNQKGLRYDEANAAIHLGLGYILKKEFDPAKRALSNAYEYFKKDSIKNIEKLSIVRHNLSLLEFERKNYPKALQEINQAIKINEQREKTNKIIYKLGDVYGFKGNVFRGLGQNDSALIYFNKAILHFLESSDIELSGNQPIQDPSLYQYSKQVLQKVSGISLLQTLNRHAKTLVTMQQRAAAADRYKKLIDLVKHTRQNFTDNASKIKLAGIVKGIYEGAIANSFAMSDYEQAFAYSEGSKVFTLLEGIRHNKALEATVRDTNTLRCEAELREKIAALDEAYRKEKDNTHRIKLSDDIQKAKAEQEKLLSQLKEDAAYRKYVEKTNPLSPKEVQSKVLVKGQTLLEYFVGEENTYLFVIPQKGAMVVQKFDIHQEEVDQWASDFYNGIYFSNDHSHYKELPKELKAKYDPKDFRTAFAEDYAQKGYLIYEQLIKPMKDQLQDKRLVIIPDGALNNVPFGALLEEAPEHIGAYHQYNFLAKEYHLSYCNSATLLHEMRSAKTKNGQGRILAFAPSFAGKDNSHKRLRFGALKHARKEVDSLKAIFQEKCDTFYGRQATLDNFLKQIAEGNYDHIHLSTHGKANPNDPDYSFISFSQFHPDTIDEKQLLYVKDLYALKLPVKTIVLSACETNRGLLQRGEGVMSFTRGLSFAGAQSILSTLWSVTDKDTKDLMVAFYNNLKKGMSKDEALTEAQKTLWADGDTRHPYYWAGMLPIGSMEEPSSGINLKAYALIGFITLLILGLFNRRRKQIA